MAINAGIFGDGTNLNDRYVSSYKKLGELVKHWKQSGLRIVLTSGTFDLFHIGHAQYLEQAKKLGDLLIVGVDSDEKVRARKGPHRPVVPEGERVLILAHLRPVDVIVLKPHKEKKNALIQIVRPDVLVVSKSTKHKKGEVDEKKQYCGKIVVLKPQAETSTSAKVRLLHVSGADKFAKEITPKLSRLIESKLSGGSKELARSIAAEIPKVIEESLEALSKK